MNDNKEGEVMHSAICPPSSMFNHDCEPSATWPSHHQGGPVSVVANRDIKTGEEISVSYVSYIGPLDSMALERQTYEADGADRHDVQLYTMLQGKKGSLGGRFDVINLLQGVGMLGKHRDRVALRLLKPVLVRYVGVTLMSFCCWS